MVPANNRALGDQAENLALRYLTEHGLVLVQRNFACRLGELDLVMRDGRYLVVVEVRYRSNRSYVAAQLTIDWRKQKKIVRTAAMFLAWHQEFATMPMRFDVVGVDVDSNNDTSISWTRDAFRPADASL